MSGGTTSTLMPEILTNLEVTRRHSGGNQTDELKGPADVSQNIPGPAKQGLSFWMCMVAIMISSFIIAVDLSGTSTALPVIVLDLKGEEFEWVGSAYALSATAFMPLSGGLAQVFGRRPIMLGMLFLFALGSALCGAATNLNFLIAGRTVQGLGAGGINSLTQIILSDLVPLKDRGKFNGLVAISFGLATAMAPAVGGDLAQHGQWRWFFYLNLPICGVAAGLVVLFLKLKTPRLTLREKLMTLDWLGNVLVISSTAAVVIALTWGGVQFPWLSAHVLVPLILGLIGLLVFLVYEACFAEIPLIPMEVLSTVTGISGYVQTFLTGAILIGTIYYIPVYFEASKSATPTASGIDVFGIAYSLVPFGVISGLSIAKSGKYRPQLCLAWVSLMVGSGLMSTLTAESSRASAIGYQILLGLGLGILMTCTFFPILAPLHPSLNANAIALFMFLRFFAQVWGVTIGGTILQNQLKTKLPAEFIAEFPSGTAIAYSIIPVIPTLKEPFRTQVKEAFADSLQVYWQVLIGISSLGFLSSLLMKALPLHTSMDDNWGLVEERDKTDSENQGPLAPSA